MCHFQLEKNQATVVDACVVLLKIIALTSSEIEYFAIFDNSFSAEWLSFRLFALNLKRSWNFIKIYYIGRKIELLFPTRHSSETPNAEMRSQRSCFILLCLSVEPLIYIKMTGIFYTLKVPFTFVLPLILCISICLVCYSPYMF